MDFIPVTEKDRNEMLKQIGVSSIADLVNKKHKLESMERMFALELDAVRRPGTYEKFKKTQIKAELESIALIKAEKEANKAAELAKHETYMRVFKEAYAAERKRLFTCHTASEPFDFDSSDSSDPDSSDPDSSLDL